MKFGGIIDEQMIPVNIKVQIYSNPTGSIVVLPVRGMWDNTIIFIIRIYVTQSLGLETWTDPKDKRQLLISSYY